MKKRKKNRDGLSRMIGKAKVKRKRNYSEIDIQFLKIELEHLNNTIKAAEEKGLINFGVVRKLQHLKSEDYKDRKDYFERYDELQRQLFIKDPSKIEKLKEERDCLINHIKKIEKKVNLKDKEKNPEQLKRKLEENLKSSRDLPKSMTEIRRELRRIKDGLIQDKSQIDMSKKTPLEKAIEGLQSVEKAVKKIKTIMKEESVNELTIDRKYLPEILSIDLLNISKTDGLPILKFSASEYFKAEGIIIKHYGDSVKFSKDTKRKKKTVG